MQHLLAISASKVLIFVCPASSEDEKKQAATVFRRVKPTNEAVRQKTQRSINYAYDERQSFQ